MDFYTPRDYSERVGALFTLSEWAGICGVGLKTVQRQCLPSDHRNNIPIKRVYWIALDYFDDLGLPEK